LKGGDGGVRSFKKARSLIGRAVSFRHSRMLSTGIQANGELDFLMKTFGVTRWNCFLSTIPHHCSEYFSNPRPSPSNNQSQDL
jgi:hypothetical protein